MSDIDISTGWNRLDAIFRVLICCFVLLGYDSNLVREDRVDLFIGFHVFSWVLIGQKFGLCSALIGREVFYFGSDRQKSWLLLAGLRSNFK